MTSEVGRKYPVGAELVGDGATFRVWAPRRNRVVAVISGSQEARLTLTDEGDGHFSGHAAGVRAGDRYYFLLDDDAYRYPDPASRFQPDGVHGASQIVDHGTYQWHDQAWKGVELPGQVIYELHIGCFTPEGTYRSATEKFAHLVETGITVIELMPVSEFHGDYGWGYDGVYWYAPTRNYGTPDDLRYLIDKAHEHGLAVILDVVYNHFGPTGNYTGAFSEHYVSHRHPTEWGDAINYDSKGAEGVREFVVQNAAFWIAEYHFDGLRLDATQAIIDDSPRHVLTDLSIAARATAGDRSVILVAENEHQDVRHVDPVEKEGGFGLDGLWNDDYHHSCRVAATGHAEFYYGDYSGQPQEILAATRWGYLYQGQYTSRAKRFRGTLAWQVPSWQFVNCLQNHDQVSNSAHGKRLHQLTSPGRARALTTLTLLSPGTPMLFMGEEFNATAPFLYFADHEVDLADLVRTGRWEYLRRFPRIAGTEKSTVKLADPSDRNTYETCKLDWNERTQHEEAWRLHHDLLKLRRTDPVFAAQDKSKLHGAVIGPEQFLLRWLDADGADRLLIVNLGRDFAWHPASEPLIAAPLHKRWQLMFSSEDELYGGSGTAMLNTKDWYLPGHAAIVLTPVPSDESA